MFKVMITQNKDLKILGRAVLTEDYETLEEAKKAGIEYSSVYDLPIFQIREYKDGIANIISFSDQDTGKIVFEN